MFSAFTPLSAQFNVEDPRGEVEFSAISPKGSHSDTKFRKHSEE